MHTIGIDYQHTMALICLREGASPSARIRSIGDGLRTLIPTAVLTGDRWGSSALLAADPARLWGNDDLRNEPWFDERGAPVFWRNLYRQLYTYLGRTHPTSANGFRTLISLPLAGYEQAQEQVSRLCQQAGLSDPTSIPITDALLCRWLLEAERTKDDELIVAVVAVGDTSSSVRAYRLHCTHLRSPHILAASSAVSLPEAGQAWWLQNIVSLIEDRTNQPIPLAYELALRDASIELGIRLSRATRNQPVPWTGPLQESLYSPLELTRQECASWPEVTRLTTALPDVLERATQALAGRGRPDLLIIGGVGAVWPFVKDAAGTLLPTECIWQSASPQQDAAWGATCWPLLAEAYIEVLQQGAVFAAPADVCDDEEPIPAYITPAQESFLEIMKLADQYADDPHSDDLFPPDQLSLS